MLKKITTGFLALSAITLLQGCTTTHNANIEHSHNITVANNANVAVLPFFNTSDTPKAGIRASIITASLLHTKDISIASLPFVEHEKMKHGWYNNMLMRCDWAKKHNIAYIMKGSINEWGYASSQHGDLPAVSISLQLRDTNTCDIVWNAVGSKTGHSNVSVTETAQKLLSHMLESVH